MAGFANYVVLCLNDEILIYTIGWFSTLFHLDHDKNLDAANFAS